MGQRHHYLPQFYLRRWTGDDGRVCRFSRPRGPVVPKRVHPKATAFVEDLYAIPLVAPHLTQWLEENFFKLVDQEANDAIKQLLDGNLKLSGKLRTGLSRFMMSLLSRTPEKVAEIKGMFAEEFDKLMQQAKEEHEALYLALDPSLSPEELAGRVASDVAQAREIGAGRVLQAAIDLPNVGLHLNNMSITILGLPDALQLSFLTSDRPLYMSKGLQHADAFVTMPLSPRKLFVASNDIVLLKKFSGSSPNDLVMQANKTVVQQAVRYVYGVDDRLLNFVEKYLTPVSEGE